MPRGDWQSRPTTGDARLAVRIADQGPSESCCALRISSGRCHHNGRSAAARKILARLVPGEAEARAAALSGDGNAERRGNDAISNGLDSYSENRNSFKEAYNVGKSEEKQRPICFSIDTSSPKQNKNAALR